MVTLVYARAISPVFFLNTKGYMTGQLRQVTDYIHFTFYMNKTETVEAFCVFLWMAD